MGGGSIGRTGEGTGGGMATQQFLNSILSQRGPSSLPYPEDAKWVVRQHAVSLFDAFPSLHPETATFTHNDGRSVNLLRADGTIPMSFQGITYNIPVVIWLTESYPQKAPCVYVNPTREMIIKRPHPHVNPSGLVSIPYLQNWIYPTSTLADLARQLGLMFGLDPPLYSRQRPNPSPIYSSSSTGPVPSRPSIPQRGDSPSPHGSSVQIPPQSLQRHYEDPAEVFRRNAIHKLTESLHADVSAFRKERESEMDGLFSVQSALRNREDQLSRGMKEMLGEKEALEKKLQMVLMNSDVADGWLSENDGKMTHLVISEVDDAIVPCDVLSRQMLDCTVQDLAIEDVIDSLDRAVQEGSIPFAQYLRNVRLLSREQFFPRAMAAKIRAAQMQARVSATMAARASYSS